MVRHEGHRSDKDVSTPMIRDPSGGEAYIVVHLFSGRRRQGDFHSHLPKLCSSAPFAVSILSLDTAVSTETGNLAEGSPSWFHIERLFLSGWVAFALAGSPCETYKQDISCPRMRIQTNGRDHYGQQQNCGADGPQSQGASTSTDGVATALADSLPVDAGLAIWCCLRFRASGHPT